jgi:hypothetical protein
MLKTNIAISLHVPSPDEWEYRQSLYLDYDSTIHNAPSEKIIMSCDVESIAELRVIENLGMQLRLENEDCKYFDGRSFKRNTYFLNNPVV